MRDSWLTSDGEIIEIEGSHNEYACHILEEEMGIEKLWEYMHENHISYPYEVLHERGWVRIKYYSSHFAILGNCIDLTRPMRNTMDPAMSERQMRVAKELCKNNKITLHMAINDKIFW